MTGILTGSALGRNGDTPGDGLLDRLESWVPIDLAPVVAGKHPQPIPTLLHTRDRRDALLYRGRVNGFHGDSGTGKSWLMAGAVAQVLAAGRRAVILDYEADEHETVARLLALGADPFALVGQLVYIRPTDPSTGFAVDQLLDVVDDTVDLVAVDSLGEAFGVDGIDENSDAEVGPWMRRVPRRIADAGPAVLTIDHSTKAGDNPLHPSGSKRKRAAITGASYLVTSTRPPTREQAGTLSLTCAKDRHGTYRRGGIIVTADITPYPDGGVTVNLHRATATTPDMILLIVAKAIVSAAKAEDRPLSRRVLLELAKVKAASETKRAALDLAVSRGYLSVETGPRGAQLHRWVVDVDLEQASR